MTSKLAVIMSIYKSDDPSFLQLALESLLNQTYPCDVFVYQDGDIPAKLQCVVGDFDNKISLISNAENKGLAYGLNVLIEKVVKGDYQYIARMDSDDISLPDRMFEQIKYLETNPEVDLCGTYCQEFGSSYALTEKRLPLAHRDLVSFSIARCPFIHPTVMFRRRVFDEGYRYPTNTSFTEDMAFWFELIHAGYKLGNVGKVLLEYRLTEDTIIRRRGFKKSMSEIGLRMKFMIALKEVTLKNIILIAVRVVFHLLPARLMCFLYRNMR